MFCIADQQSRHRERERERERESRWKTGARKGERRWSSGGAPCDRRVADRSCDFPRPHRQFINDSSAREERPTRRDATLRLSRKHNSPDCQVVVVVDSWQTFSSRAPSRVVQGKGTCHAELTSHRENHHHHHHHHHHCALRPAFRPPTFSLTRGYKLPFCA